MISFKNDYSELAHQNILDLMKDAASEQNNGYGLDDHSLKAASLIKKEISSNVDVHFLVGGTSCNKVVISHVLKPYQAVIAVESGHINVHETGAIEACGHKVITIIGNEGKAIAEQIRAVFYQHCDEHMVEPKMVYISNSTELGSIYSKQELQDLHQICQELNLYLYLDGARLAVALTANENDLTLNDIANLTDVFYIGGTKNGALLGEAVVIVNDHIKDSFRYSIKQNGGLLAKGFVAGLQFEGLFTNNLFFELGKHANQMAQSLKKGLIELNVKLAFDSPTNQQFITLDNQVINKLKEKYLFEEWEKFDNSTTIRLVTSWATSIKSVDYFLSDLEKILKPGN
jgi:threonine aldolase